MQKGFTLIELMVVIVIIGILSALAIPKMFGVSAKAKFAEAPGVIANWETLVSAYAQETGTAGTLAQIGFQPITSPQNANGSRWFSYALGGGNLVMTATVFTDFSACDVGHFLNSTFVVASDTYTHGGTAACRVLGPNF